MLGRGTAFSTYVYADLQPPSFFLAHLSDYAHVDVWLADIQTKVLTADATEGNKAAVLHEVEIMQVLTTLDDNDYPSLLLDHFERRGPRGRRLYFMMEPLMADINSFRQNASRKLFPLHTIKMVMIHVLEALKLRPSMPASRFCSNVFLNWT
jgi:hypothetical protein